MTEPTTKHCNRCNAILSTIEARSETCNRCLDLGYQSMSDEEYDAREEAHIDRVLRPSWGKANARIYALAAFLALTTTPAHAAPSAHDWHAPTPAGCTEVGHFEDGTIIATCSDGSKVAIYDPDGQVHPAAPYRAPGTWYGAR